MKDTKLIAEHGTATINTRVKVPLPKPLPCPFCGLKPKFTFFKEGTAPEIESSWWSLGCRNRECANLPSTAGITKAEAIANWNTRTPEAK